LNAVSELYAMQGSQLFAIEGVVCVEIRLNCSCESFIERIDTDCEFSFLMISAEGLLRRDIRH
jgi:hypothetical protein